MSISKTNMMIGAVVAAMWSWLLLVDVAIISDAKLLGWVVAGFAFAVMVAISTVVFGLVVRYTHRALRRKDASPWRRLVEFFCMWAGAELLVSWLVAVVWIGRDGSLDSVLPFASFTPFLMYTPLRFLARLVGFYGLSALLVTCVMAAAHQRTRKLALPIAAISIVLSGAMWLPYRQASGNEIAVQVMAETLSERVPAAETSADLVVFPEYGLDDITNDNLGSRLVAPTDHEVYFLGSRQDPANGNAVYNNLIFGSSQKGLDRVVPKTRLIPGGEYLPFAVDYGLRAAGADAILNDFEFSRAVQKGASAVPLYEISDGDVVGSEVCASIIAPNDYRNLTRHGATVLTNSASLEIFRSPVFDIQQKGLGIFMATANARPFLQSANSSSAFALDHNGSVLASTQPVGSAQATVRTNHATTPYAVLGEWVSYIGLILIAVRSFPWVKARAKRSSKHQKA